MKNLKLLMLLALSIVLLSCSSKVSDEVILRGTNVRTGMVAPLLTTFRYNIYKIGDTVWVDTKTMKINQFNSRVRSLSLSYEKYIIEEDNDAMNTNVKTKFN